MLNNFGMKKFLLIFLVFYCFDISGVGVFSLSIYQQLPIKISSRLQKIATANNEVSNPIYHRMSWPDIRIPTSRSKLPLLFG